MKVLIWFLTFFIATILNALLGYTTGFKVGSLVFYVAVYFVANALCKKWDKRKHNKTMVSPNHINEDVIQTNDSLEYESNKMYPIVSNEVA